MTTSSEKKKSQAEKLPRNQKELREYDERLAKYQRQLRKEEAKKPPPKLMVGGLIFDCPKATIEAARFYLDKGTHRPDIILKFLVYDLTRNLRTLYTRADYIQGVIE